MGRAIAYGIFLCLAFRPVVPANAGTHTARILVSALEQTPFSFFEARGDDGVAGPVGHRDVREGGCWKSQKRGPSVNQIIRIGMDTSKHFFQLHGVDTAERPVLRRKLRRKEMAGFFAKLPPTEIGMEACGAAHYWGRVLRELGHTVKLIAPQHVKPYIKRNKNDGRDAEGICEAMSRPTMQFVPVKTEEQQAALMLVGMRERLVARRTQLSNAIRGYAAEFGLTAAKGLDKIEPLLAKIAADEALPVLARDLFAMHGREYVQLQAELKKIEARLMAWHRANTDSRRLAQIPGIGPVVATTLVMKAPDPRLFPSGRHFAAWIGLTPKDHSTAGKTRLGTITRAGDEMLRSVLVAGATAVIQQARRGPGRASPSLLALLARKSSPKLAAIALANKIGRIAWKLLVTGESYHAGGKPIASAHAA